MQKNVHNARCVRFFLHRRRWFKGGKEVAPYDGERTLDGVMEWVANKQADGAL